MSSNIKISCTIDSDFINRAEEELILICANQLLSFYNRFTSSLLYSKFLHVLRVIGISVSIIGVILGIFVIIVEIITGKSNWQSVYHLLFCISGGFLFYWLPQFFDQIRHKGRKNYIKLGEKLARIMLKKAKKLAPYQAEYEINANLITYCRVKNDSRKSAWSRKAGGVAYYGNKTTLFFRKWNSILPRMLILHGDVDSMEPLLDQKHIEFKPISIDHIN